MDDLDVITVLNTVLKPAGFTNCATSKLELAAGVVANDFGKYFVNDQEYN